jgi:hypothetical protein
MNKSRLRSWLARRTTFLGWNNKLNIEQAIRQMTAGRAYTLPVYMSAYRLDSPTVLCSMRLQDRAKELIGGEHNHAY